MSNIAIIFKREINAYFTTPIAYIFIIIFLIMVAAFTFFLGGFLLRNQADLLSFFQFHPWLYIILIPALTMRLWSEEIQTGTIELLLTLPINIMAAIIAKFLAAWALIAIALGLTFPIWITVNYLGEPDNGVIIASYIGSLLMAGGFLAIGSFISATTKNQVIAFIVSTSLCFLFTASGSPMIISFFSPWAADGILNFIINISLLGNFQNIIKGVIDMGDIIYFLSLIMLFLFATKLVIDAKKDA